MKSSIWRMRQIPEIHLWPIKWIKRKVENFLLSNNMEERAQQFFDKFQQLGHPQREGQILQVFQLLKKKKIQSLLRKRKTSCAPKIFSAANEKRL